MTNPPMPALRQNDGLLPLAVYVHWPWCKAKCPYCDFNSHASEINEDAYVDALLGEFRSWNEPRVIGALKTDPFTPQKRRISSVFFGGGTPSLMGTENFARVIDACRKLGVIDAETEITVECNPTSFDEMRDADAFFRQLKAVGVNRISIGVQGLKQEWLTFLGRAHRVEDALATLDAALGVFDNVNADVIYGLPNQRLEEWLQQLETLTQRGLTHISAYQLTIEPNTLFFKDVRRGRWAPISGDLEADFFDATRTALQAHGYENYEISNFAKPGQACRHNVHVWQYGEYLGIGAGAHGRVISDSGIVVATQIVRQPDGYLRRMKDLADPVSLATPLNGPETIQEAVFSGLRLATGVDVESLRKRYGETAYAEAVLSRETTLLVDSGLLIERNGYLQLTERGWPLLNGVLQRILPILPPQPAASGTSMSHINPTASADTPSPNEYNHTVSVTIL